VARQGRAQSRAQRNNQGRDNQGLLPVLAQAVRSVENDAKRGRLTMTSRATFQAVAILTRQERTRIKADTTLNDAKRAEQIKRLEGIATILATTAAIEPSLFDLLVDDAEVLPETREVQREMQQKAGLEVDEEPKPQAAEVTNDRRVVPRAVITRQLANPFMAPSFDDVAPRPQSRRLESWELLTPLLSSFERAPAGAVASMDLPEAAGHAATGPDLMRHQARVVAAAAEGHRTFLLADEPGLGKTAQALLAAQAANAYPLLVVVPNVVKINWAREAELWTPKHRATVIHGDGDDLDAFADIIVVNYEILDRHVGWLGELGFRGMVVDEAHFIKNKTSLRSRNVLQLSKRIRQRVSRPLLMALTGTPLINDIEDFLAIWEFLGWIDGKKPVGKLMATLEETGLTPLDRGFMPSARQSVIDMGIVRRRKEEVAADIPARRIADILVELSDEAGRSIRAAEAALAKRLLRRYDAAVEAGSAHPGPDGLDHDLIRRVARAEREDSSETKGDNVFTMVRQLGIAKADLAADYAAQLVHSVGKVVFFAKHIDVMDAAEKMFADRGIQYVSIRGDQSTKARQEAVDAFTNDPDVSIAVCSLMAAGVGLNLQVASNVVLAELSWTDAEQQQAIDRVHRIGQDMPVTAWRVIAAQTLDPRIAALVQSKSGLAAKALDGADIDLDDPVDIQTETLVGLLTDTLRAR
jgi:superfamily II DNA or RNA helicase